MKRCLLVIRECPVKPKLDTTIHLPEWLKLKSLIILNVGKDVNETTRTLKQTYEKYKLVQPLWKTVTT